MKEKKIDMYEECEKCQRDAKKWLKRALWSFVVFVVTAAMFFLGVPGSDLWSIVSCISLFLFVAFIAFAYGRWTDQMIYANWGGWF